jgi:hypothetical protein
VGLPSCKGEREFALLRQTSCLFFCQTGMSDVPLLTHLASRWVYRLRFKGQIGRSDLPILSSGVKPEATFLLDNEIQLFYIISG